MLKRWYFGLCWLSYLSMAVEKMKVRQRIHDLANLNTSMIRKFQIRRLRSSTKFVGAITIAIAIVVRIDGILVLS